MERRPKSLFSSSELPRHLLIFAVLAIFSLLTVAVPILVFGFPDGGYDQPQHLRFAVSFHDSLSLEHSLPKWGNDTLGFGSVGVRFYPPLASVSASVAYAIAGEWQTAFMLTLLFWMFVGSLGVYFFCADWVDYKFALMGGILFTVLPYHLIQIYQYFLFAEFIALSILPFCFLFLTRLLGRREWNDAIFFGVSISLLTLAHIPSALLFGMVFPVFLVAMLDWKNWARTASLLCVSSLTSLLLSCFYWVKVLGEFNWVAHVNSKYTTGIYSYSLWLFPNYFVPRRSYELWLMSLFLDIIIVLTCFFLIPATLYTVLLLRQKPSFERKLFLALSLCSGISLFMLTRPSEWLWANLPFLGKTQFPFRWLTFLSFLAAASFAICIPSIVKRSKKWIRPTVYFASLVFLLIGLFDVTQIIPQIMPISEEKFGKRLESLTSKLDNHPWWPVWATEQAVENREPVSSTRSVEVSRWEGTEKVFAVAGGRSESVRIATFFYPFWKASVNGSEVLVGMNDDGTVLLPIPSEPATVRMYFQEPAYYTMLGWLSATAWLVVAFSTAFSVAGVRDRILGSKLVAQREVRYAK